MIRMHHQAMGMPEAAMPLLRMQSQTTTLDLLNQISRPLTCKVADCAAEDRLVVSTALDVVMQIASLSPGSYSSLARWTVQKPSCKVAELTGTNGESNAQLSKSRWKQLVEKIGAFVASIPPIILVMHLVQEECRKVRELQDKCIAIEQNDIWRDTWSTIRDTCCRGAQSTQFHQHYDDSAAAKEKNSARMLNVHLRCCMEILEGAKERCKLAEELYQRQYFRLDLLHYLKFLKEHYPTE